MKKKFDFSAEIECAEARTNQEYWEPESTSEIVQLLDNIVYNLKDLSSLNHTVIQLRRTLKNFLETVPVASDYAKEQAIKQGQAEASQNLTLATNHLVERIDAKCKEAEKRIRDINDYVSIPINSIYIVLVLIIVLSAFMLCILILNIQFWHSWLIWKCLGITTGITAIGITLILYLPHWIRNFQKWCKEKSTTG